MGRQKRAYPLGKYRLRAPKTADKDKAYPIELEYSWNRQIFRKATNIFARIADWNENGNMGRGELRASYGPEYKAKNGLLLHKVETTDNLFAQYNEQHPGEISAEVVRDILDCKPITRKDEGTDFVDYVLERLSGDRSRNQIGKSRYENGRSCMRIFQEFLLSTGKGTYKPDSIYLGELTPTILQAYIDWRRNVKRNADETINHALTPIIKTIEYAAKMGKVDEKVAALIGEMRVIVKRSANETDGEEVFDGKSLTKDQLAQIVDYYNNCNHERRRDYIEMFLFAFHACGLRIVDVLTLQWAHINFEKKELRKVMVKTRGRLTIPLSDPALAILKKWREKIGDKKYVFDLVKDENLDLDNQDALYSERTNATKCINQSLLVIGEELKCAFPLTMHVARHTFAVLALNDGMSMSVVSRLLGHSTTDVTEKIYARFLPQTLSNEVERLGYSFVPSL